MKSEKEGNGNRSMEQMRNLILNLREIRCPSCLLSICTLSNTATNGMKVYVFKFFDLGRIVIVIARCTEVLADKIRKARDPTFFSKHRKTWELFPQNIPSEMEVAPPPGWHKLRALLPDHSELFPLIALVLQTKFLHKKVFWVQKHYL